MTTVWNLDSLNERTSEQFEISETQIWRASSHKTEEREKRKILNKSLRHTSLEYHRNLGLQQKVKLNNWEVSGSQEVAVVSKQFAADGETYIILLIKPEKLEPK